MLSGIAATRSDKANSDGPARPGICVWLVVQAPLTISTAANVARLNRFPMILLIPEVAKIHLERAGGADIVADLIAPVQRHLSDRGDDDAVGFELDQRRLHFG